MDSGLVALVLILILRIFSFFSFLGVGGEMFWERWFSMCLSS